MGGRSDLNVSILECALLHIDSARGGQIDEALVLATDVVDSFEAIRTYLRKVGQIGLEKIDPQLCNNIGLVERLVNWEKSWEIGLKFISNAPMFDAVHALLGEV